MGNGQWILLGELELHSVNFTGLAAGRHQSCAKLISKVAKAQKGPKNPTPAK